VLSRDPWVIIFDNFLSDAEAKALISNVDQWEQSTDTGDTNEFGETGRILSAGRTSSNAWCQWECEKDPNIQSITAKIQNVTTVPKANYESFQILR
jgi:prolyl 4-hydroxylase